MKYENGRLGVGASMMLRCTLLGLLLVLNLGSALAQVCSNDAFGPTACFRVYDDATGQLLDVPGQPVTVLCAGSRIRLRDCSGQNYPRQNIRYIFDCFSTTNTNLDTLTTRTVPNTPGTLIIQQNTPNPGGPGYPTGTGQLFSRRFEVRARPQPDFTFAYCGTARTQVQITVLQPQANVQYEVQVGSGPRQPVTQPTAVYAATPGATTITVFGNYRDARICEGATTKPYPVQAAPQSPVLQRLVVQGATLEFGFAALQPEYRYVLEQDGSSITTLPTGSTTFSLANGALGSCYRLRLTDACGSLSLPSAQLCPVSLAATSANGQNQLSWVQPPGSNVTDYQISRNGQVLTTVPATTTAYTDAAVTCGQTYRYQITARTANGTSLSDTRTVQTSVGQAAAPPQLSVSIALDNTVEVTTLGPALGTGSRLQLRRFVGSAAPQLLPPAQQLPVTDQPGAASPERIPCYTGVLIDECGTTSAEGPAACPPTLGAQAADADGNQVRLRWTEPSGQGTGWTYRLITLDANNRELRNQPVSGTAYLDTQPPTERQVLRYRLAATSNGRTVYSNIAAVSRRVVVVVPNAFSPNADGLNDVLEVKGRFLSTFNFTIFDRNGVVVFRGTDRTQTWDGRVRGVVAAPQVFSFQFEAIDETGQRVVQHGTITLLR
ncbi:gliding motility-associated C-terminal domain-containing protein [Solirubrum puertoriconensis]|uniref:Fibronectin type-III domain-containing protein n=1 Tax=Solirubrum puertoriconensis TaxID=1751427 RepID=A0A9X0L4I2_SOLP1|nr:gliding motility-associated C-terminal domain-containing protein [Solirubrum puertoriconensis]KUG07477.1 hypothetical protein ASU33_14100 [Solirubrum puertoriconensis]